MKRVVFVLFASVLFLTSYTIIIDDKDVKNRERGSGNIVNQERTASEFYAITMEGVANVNVQQGDEHKVVVTTDDNLQDFVLVEVKNNVLHINTKPNINIKPTKLIVDVHLPELQSINLEGVGNVKLSNGKASDLKISLSGVGNIDAKNYQIQNLVIKHSGVGKAIVWATNSLNGTLSGVGNILYKGNPAVNLNVSGIGKIKKLQ
jgi:hypothetical protein